MFHAAEVFHVEQRPNLSACSTPRRSRRSIEFRFGVSAMGWEDRPYYRDRPTSAGGPLQWLFYGSVPLFEVFGIRVRAHASLVVIAGLTLLFGIGAGSGVAGRVQFVTALFCVILLHEFGHCFAARWTGGSADEILMTPLGGLAMAMSRRRPWPTFVTVAGGPLVNVAICLVLGVAIYLISGVALVGPWQFGNFYGAEISPTLLGPLGWMFFVYAISYGLLVFNLLPVFPLDGGQLLQAILWRPMGYYRSMLLTLAVGMVGSVLMAMVGLASLGSGFGFLILIIGVNCFVNCFQMRKSMVAEGPWAFSDEDSADFAADSGGASGLFGVPDEGRDDRDDRPRGLAGIKQRIGERRAEKQREADARDYQSVDDILAKISRSGIGSLTRSERRTLERTTARSRLKR